MTIELGYFTLGVPDTARGRAFYGGLFGWQFDAGADARYAHVSNTRGVPCGLVQAEAGAAPPQLWFRVTDIRAAVKRVRELGGQADEPKKSPSGWGADCRDDQGGKFSLWEPAEGY